MAIFRRVRSVCGLDGHQVVISPIYIANTAPMVDLGRSSAEIRQPWGTAIPYGRLELSQGRQVG